jgi:putative endonuclease
LKKQQIGRWGEEVAARYLEERGYRVLRRNHRTPYGEIDLVVQKEQTTVFVEVKARTGEGFGLPESSVTAAKRLHLLRAIQAYWQAQEAEGDWRVDVVAVIGRPGEKDVEVEHFENAITT